MRRLVAIALTCVLLGAGCMSADSSQFEQEAVSWVENNAPTYVYDGSNARVGEVVQGGCSTCWEIFVDFDSAAAGYGDRSDVLTAQVITPHTTRVRFVRGEITEAITDEAFDEINQRELTTIQPGFENTP